MIENQGKVLIAFPILMLDEAIKTISGMSERDIYMRILNAKSRESRAKERRGA